MSTQTLRRAALALVLASWVLHPVIAAEDDRLHWGMGEDAFRFDLEEDLSARVVPEAKYAVTLEKIRLVSQSDFDAKHRKLGGEVRDLSDLVWWAILSLPEGEFRGAGGQAAISERFSFPGTPGEIAVTGKDEVKRSGGKATLRATLDIVQDKLGEKQKPWIAKGTTLVIERTYDSKKKLVLEARFDLKLQRQDEDKVHAVEHVGKVVLAGKVDRAAKQFLADVQGAIKRGTGYLQEQLSKRLGAYKTMKEMPVQGLGYVALPTFALLRSGVPPANLKEAFDYMATCEWREVYSVSLYVMCLEAKSVRREEVPPQAGGRTVARFRKDPLPKQDREEMIRAARWLVAVRKHGEGWWSYGGNPGRALEGPVPDPSKGTLEKAKKNGENLDDEGFPLGHDYKTKAERGDRSNSQFATLALLCAAASDCLLDSGVWGEILEELAMSQESEGPAQSLRGVEWTPAAPQGIAPDGGADPFAPNATRSRDSLQKDYGEGARARGWAYPMREARTGGSYGSMSGAGLSSVAIAREALRRAGKLTPELEAKSRRAIHDGVAWFLQNWNVRTNPKNGGWYYYYLYSVEKAMETAGVEKLGPHEWWREGAAQLLALEDNPKKGSWNGGNVEDTSFALLFLNRATLPASIVTQDTVRAASGERDPDAWDQVFVEGTGHVRLRQVLYAIETATPDLVKERIRIAEKGLEVLEEDRRPRLVPELLRLMQLGKDVRRFAQRWLKIASGVEDEAKARTFHARWLELARACEERDYGSIGRMRALLRDAEATHALKRTICIALSRLRGVEAVGDLIGELNDKDPSYRRHVATTIVQLLGGEKSPYDPAGSDADRGKQLAEWKAWWEKNREKLVFEEEARRLVEALADDALAPAAEPKLLQMGKRALRQIVDGLIEPRSKKRAHALLEKITGQKLPAETRPWLDWWEKNGGKS